MWSHPLAQGQAGAVRYVDLMGGSKPHLLVGANNNMGAETRLTYAPSTKFYLLSTRRCTPWITRLPFPVQVLERVESFDHIARTRLVNHFRYHHGYYDSVSHCSTIANPRNSRSAES